MAAVSAVVVSLVVLLAMFVFILSIFYASFEQINLNILCLYFALYSH